MIKEANAFFAYVTLYLLVQMQQIPADLVPKTLLPGGVWDFCLALVRAWRQSPELVEL